ncbi:Sir2 family NAD-dependent protein deacetylase [Halorubrum vacuolatum]|uniref:NAD-dependent deacetylase n=1 Tax=Halorubrum vacuolatum TaxID=63740 RepID=A0A238VES6_HALVU|nr:Sir2 family NAD-dependent protein deacetylase [Halorubrum vacuolatum]SNR32557.1 NAD-dependent deacetylase [Halorubrum vacuolatum]
MDVVDSDRDGDVDTLLDRLAEDLRAAGSAVALTGAGLSAASGIPTFRGEDGIWGDVFDPSAFHRSRFARDPAGFWRDRLALYDHMEPQGGAEPNAAHRALAELVDLGLLEAVITQNTDGLHHAADTADVIELHGTNARVVCVECDRSRTATPVRRRARGGELPPTCECGGPFKPDVVLFGELLPAAAHRRAKRLAAESDVFIAAGSSLTVDPAASLPTRIGDGTLAVINLERTRYADTAAYDIRADVTDALPALLDRVRG